jgi:threonine dehydrogenase-like Zn-dependent dehydrogenase
MDKFPLGLVINKSLTVPAALQDGRRHIPVLLELTTSGKLDASYLATHTFSLEEGQKAYDVFNKKENGCIRAVLKP